MRGRNLAGKLGPEQAQRGYYKSNWEKEMSTERCWGCKVLTMVGQRKTTLNCVMTRLHA